MKFLKYFKALEAKDVSSGKYISKQNIDDYIEYLSTMPEGEEKERKKEELGANMFGKWMPEEDIDSKKFNDPNWDDYVWDGDNYKYKPKNVTKYTVDDFAISTSGDNGWGFGDPYKSRKKNRDRLADETPTFEAHPFAGQYSSNFEEDKRKLFTDDEYNQLVDDINKEEERKKLKQKYYDSGYIVSSLDDYMHSYKPSKDYKPRKKTRDDLANSTPTFESKKELLLNLSEYLQEFFDKYQISYLQDIDGWSPDPYTINNFGETSSQDNSEKIVAWVGMEEDNIVIDNIPDEETCDVLLEDLYKIKNIVEKRLDCDIDIVEIGLCIEIRLKNYHPLDDPNY